jgi:hypothetical protein
LANAIPKTLKVAIAAMLVKSQKAEIFQVCKRNITIQKIADNWDNNKTVLLDFAIIYCRIF